MGMMYAAIRVLISLELFVIFDVHHHDDPCTDGNFITISSNMALMLENVMHPNPFNHIDGKWASGHTHKELN